jgi:hypothetical protein
MSMERESTPLILVTAPLILSIADAVALRSPARYGEEAPADEDALQLTDGIAVRRNSGYDVLLSPATRQLGARRR